MNIQQLEYILAVDQYRHFAKAAEHCRVTQPTLSMMIQKLEDELGVKIFDRALQPIRPTPAGKKIIEQARVVLHQAALIKDIVNEEEQSLKGTFHLAVLPTIAPYLLPRFFPAMMEKKEELDIRVMEMKTAQAIKALIDGDIDAAIIANDRDSHQRDLYEAIERGDFPRWTFRIQVMTEEEARTYRINPFDLTKVWPHKDFPLIDVGVLELNRNPENYFAEVEQAAFNPQNIVEGIGFSPDKMLQGRLFSYGDAQRYRLGVNHEQIPVNRPRCPFHAYHRDGAMRVDGNYGSTIGYEPNSYGQWQESPETKEPPLAAQGDIYNYDAREYDDDYYSQPGDLFRLMSPEQQQVLCENTARNMGPTTELFIKQRHVRNCYKADPAYGEGVARALGIDLQEALQATR